MRDDASDSDARVRCSDERGVPPLEHHDLEAVLDRAHQTSVHITTVAGLVAGLLLGIGFLGLRDGDVRFAVAIWAVGLAVTLGLAVAARQLRGAAESMTEIGLVALGARAHVETVQAGAAQRLGEVQSQLQRLQSDVDRYLRTPPEVPHDQLARHHEVAHHTHDHEDDLAPTAAIERPAS